ncbi:MAG: CCA-adding enzyme [uncultured Acidilobus sp. OSP8]|nr:MAG: CCA-adding enzyme [uncultured Acidilobus sp. OSP8]
MMGCPGRGPIEERVLEVIRPTEIQLRLLSRAYDLIKRALERSLVAHGLDFVIEPEGSFAKGTLLRDRWEMDVFVLFKGVDEGWVLSESLGPLREALQGFPVISKFSEHPYLTVSLMGMEIDVVPAIYAERPSTGLGVGRTPFHTRYVRSKLDDCMADEVRLLKSFLKGIGAYGAETHVRGFSGYMAELLTIAYGSFRAAVKAMSEWTRRAFVDPERIGNRGELERRYPESPLIVVDPVDPMRNAAAAVSEDKLALAVLASKLYLHRPSLSFFHVFADRIELRQRPPVIVIVCNGKYYEEPPEGVWGRLSRASRMLAKELEAWGFTPLRASYFTDEGSLAAIGVSLASDRLEGLEVLKGPDAWANVENIRAFIGKRLEEGGLWVGDRLYGFRGRRLAEAGSVARSWLAAHGNLLGDACRAVSVSGGDLSGVPGPLREWLWKEFYTVPSWLAGL